MEEADRRRMTWNGQISGKAKQRAREWDARYKGACNQRNNVQAKSDGNLIRKQQENTERRNRLYQTRHDEAARKGAEKNAMVASRVANCRDILAQTQANTWNRIVEKDIQSINHVEFKNQAYAEANATKDYDAKCAEYIGNKQFLEQEKRNKAQAEIDVKEARLRKNLHKTHESPIVRIREMCRGGSLSGTMRSMQSMQSPSSQLQSGYSSVRHLPALLAGSASTPSLGGGSPCFHLDNEDGSPDRKHSTLSELEVAARAASKSRKRGMDDSEDRSSEKILNELENRSSKWLQELRAKRDVTNC